MDATGIRETLTGQLALGFEIANAAGEQGRLIPPDPDIENTMLAPSPRAPHQPEEEGR